MTPPAPARVAVVVPCHNYGGYLGDAIDSALAQTHRPHEVVVVDDGSSDETAAVAGALRGSVTYVRQARAGANSARNRGLRQVQSSDYVLFLDADDVLAPNYVAAGLQALAAAPEASYAYTQVARFGDEEGVSSYPQWSLEELLRKNFIHMTALFRISVAREFPFDERLRTGSMDWDRFLSMAAAGHRGVLVDEPLLLYRRHAESIQRGLRHAPHRRHILAVRLAWKHRRLYGVRLAGQVGYHVYMALRHFGRAALRTSKLRARRFAGRMLRRYKPRRFPSR